MARGAANSTMAFGRFSASSSAVAVTESPKRARNPEASFLVVVAFDHGG